MLIINMTQFDTALNSMNNKCHIDFQYITRIIIENIQIPSTTLALTQLIVIQLIGFFVFTVRQ